jgi:hypothetical protein
MDNWLVKLCSKQPTNEKQVERQLDQLPYEDLVELSAGREQPEYALDSLEVKVAQAEQLGREMARNNGQEIMNQVEQEALIEAAVASLPDEEAIKVAAALSSGELTKEAFLKEAFLGAALGAVRGGAARALGSNAAKKTVKFMARNPGASMAIGGAAAGGLATGDLRGAALGAAGGYGLHRLAPGISQAATRGAGKAYGWGRRNMGAAAAPGFAKTASIKGLSKTAASKFVKQAFGMCPEGTYNSWLQQFEGTPLLEQALSLEQQDLDAGMQEVQQRSESRARNRDMDDAWETRDALRLQKRLLELQLVAQRNGLSEPDGDELGGPATTADHPEPEGDEPQMAPQQPQAPATGAAPQQDGTLKVARLGGAYPSGSSHLEDVPQDKRFQDHKNYLQQKSQEGPTSYPKAILGGAAVGGGMVGLPGLALGAIAGAPKAGAIIGSAIGAALGGLIGGKASQLDRNEISLAQKALSSDTEFDKSFKRQMEIDREFDDAIKTASPVAKALIGGGAAAAGLGAGYLGGHKAGKGTPPKGIVLVPHSQGVAAVKIRGKDQKPVQLPVALARVRDQQKTASLSRLVIGGTAAAGLGAGAIAGHRSGSGKRPGGVVLIADPSTQGVHPVVVDRKGRPSSMKVPLGVYNPGAGKDPQ